MIGKAYTLSSCDTSNRILKESDISTSNFIIKDIKQESITESELNEMHKMVGSYEALFSRRAQKYKALGLKDKNLTELEIRQYILDEYTFLKRPVIIIKDRIFVGNSKKNVTELKEYLRDL